MKWKTINLKGIIKPVAYLSLERFFLTDKALERCIKRGGKKQNTRLKRSQKKYESQKYEKEEQYWRCYIKGCVRASLY